ncbi:mRNA splicing factor [Phytophthora cinnamomi]|uniref:mRNA splicing factor n=1 Tax=Phytophthora cinnamomi TaxID=4785 RepID=UPI00355A43F3|nr:mRNA splicing factor [Phytophthora cinnamomi]
MDGAGGDSAADLFSRVLRGAEHESASEQSSSSAAAAVGGFLVCLDVPAATEFGVDYEVFRTGSKFQGVKFLPLGIHFVVFRSREQEHGIRQGFFVHVERHAQVIVREWSLEKEELGPPRPSLNVDNLERAVLSFQLDSGLGPYPKQHLKTWQRLSNFMTPSVLQRSGVEFGAILLPGDAVEDAATSTKAQEGVIPYFPDLPRTVRFTALQKTRADLSAEARTTYHFDRSERLEELIQTDFGGDWKELIGELQLSFLVFLQLSSLAALEQWKQFIALLCSCEQALSTHVALFLAFIKLFRTQLEQIPEDFFQDETTSENFLGPCLLSLLELLEDDDAPPQLRQKAFHLRQLLASRFGWDAGAELLELDEFAPVVVPEDELRSAATDDVAPLPTATELQARQQRQRDEEEAANAAIAAAFLRS